MKKTTISLQIKGLRDDLGLKQVELAKKIGVSPRTLASWETGERNPQEHQIHRLVRICNESHPDVVKLHFPDAPLLYHSGSAMSESDTSWKQIATEWKEIADERKEKIAELQKIIDGLKD